VFIEYRTDANPYERERRAPPRPGRSRRRAGTEAAPLKILIGVLAGMPKASLYGLVLSPTRDQRRLFGLNHNRQESFGGSRFVHSHG